MRIVCLVAALLSAVAVPSQGRAQELPTFTRWDADAALFVVHAGQLDSAPRGTGTLMLAGFSGAVIGTYAGALIGQQVARGSRCTGDWCGLNGVVAGAIVGSSLMAALSVHLTNHDRGSLGAGVLASATAFLGTVGLAHVTGEPAVLFLLPLAQAGAAASVERATTPRMRPYPEGT